MRVALDAMGGDFAPTEPVRGAILALAEDPELEVALVGDEAVVSAELRRQLAELASLGALPADGVRDRVRLVHAPDAVPDGGHPAQYMRSHPETSVARAARLVADGAAHAAVSTGHTGASVIAASWHLGLLPGVDRPTAGVPFAFAPRALFLDLGLNPEPKPHHLYTFAVLGAAFAKCMLDVPNPRVALISNGAEEGKGTEVVRRAYELLRRSHLDFVGNAEGFDLFSGRADVFVCDGFTGNVLIKFLEGFSQHLIDRCRELGRGREVPELDELVRELRQTTDITQVPGGFAILGVGGVFVPGHGRSPGPNIRSLVLGAKEMVRRDLPGAIRRELAAAGAGPAGAGA
ncbi:MAG: phosphate acyltransferase [Clostridia bacterium]|nr:phosphate acyltransferase [Clostridia bacterium]